MPDEQIPNPDLPLCHVAQDPGLIAPPPANLVDPTTAFLTYISFLGDVQKTAAALDVSAGWLTDMAQRENWAAKVEALIALKKEKGAEALAREFNRTACFVQGVRIRNLIERVLAQVFADEHRFEDLIAQRSAKVDNFTAKGLVELAKAAEIAHRLCYQALGDSLTERVARDEDDASIVSLGVLRALSQATSSDITDPTKHVRQKLLTDECREQRQSNEPTEREQQRED